MYTEQMYITLDSRMTVTKQEWSYQFMSYIAEVGGYVGLFLGYAVLDLTDVINNIISKINQLFKFK